MANSPDAWTPPRQDELRTPPHNDEAERSLLGAIFLDNRVVDEVLAIVQPEDLYRESHRHIFRAMAALHARGDAIDVITVADYLGAEKLLDAVGGPNFLARLSSEIPSAANVSYYATIISRKAALRNFITTAHALIDECYNDVTDFEAFMDSAESKLFAITQAGAKKGYATMREVIKEAFAQIESLYQKAEQVTGVPSGFIDLDEITAGWQPSDLIIVAARPAMGKCLSAGTEVLLADGRLRTMAQLHEAKRARVAALDAGYLFDGAEVSDFIDDGEKPVFEVVTRSGRRVEVTAVHPLLTLEGWKPLHELRVGARIGVPRELPFFGDQAEHEAKVKLCAYLLGDGCLTQGVPRFTQSNDELVADFSEAVEGFGGLKVTCSRDESRTPTYRIVRARESIEGAIARENPLKGWLQEIGLWGCTASEKFIPEFVFSLPRPQLALFLNRLFATDGWASQLATGQVQIGYASISERLVRQIAHLLLRFGILTSVRAKRDPERGAIRAWQLDLTHEPSCRRFASEIGILSKMSALEEVLARQPSRSPNLDVIPTEIFERIAQRKGSESWSSLAHRAGLETDKINRPGQGISRERLEKIAIALEDPELIALSRSQVYWDEIVAITPLGKKQVYDLTVPGHHNFVAQDVCVHNTALTLNMAAHAAIERKVPVAYFSLEMANVQLAIRMLCSEARIDQSKLRTGRMTEQEWARLIKAAGTLSESKIFLDDTPALPIMEFRSKARLLKAEHDIGIIFIDYLQLMKARGSNIGSREQEISEISRNLKGIAKELQVPVIALAQLNRGVESRADKRPMNSDLRECVVGETLVQLTDGSRRAIESLVGETPEVWAIDEQGKLVKAFSDRIWPVGEREVFELKLATGRTIRATAKHRLLTGGGWKQLSELEQGARVALVRHIPAGDSSTMSDAQLILLGHMIGDGSYLKGQPMRYASKDEDNIAALTGAVEAFGCTWRRYEAKGGAQIVISGNGNRWTPAGVNAWLRELGIFNQRSHEKQVPAQVFQQDEAKIALFLRHLWATDGCIHVRSGKGSHAVYYSTNSQQLAQDVSALLTYMGIIARLKTTQKKGYKPQYHVHITGKEAQLRFLDVVGSFGPRRLPAETLRKSLDVTGACNTNVDTLPMEFFDRVQEVMAREGITQRAMAHMRGTSYGGASHFRFAPSRKVAQQYAALLEDDILSHLATSDIFWDQVISITSAGIEQVYDLTVPGPASWLANDGIVSHNSGAIEQDADIISFIYRDEVYNPESEHKGIAEFILGKHRNGGLGTVRLRFFGQYTRFENLAPEMAEALGPIESRE